MDGMVAFSGRNYWMEQAASTHAGNGFGDGPFRALFALAGYDILLLT
jgi:hypothetical protein